MRSHILDQEIQHDRMVIVLAVDHLIDLRHSFSEAKVVQSNPFGGGARKLIRVPGIHISVFQNVAQRVGRAHDHLAWDCVRVIQKRIQDVLGVELLHTIQAHRLLRIELSLFQTTEETVPNPVIREQVVAALMRIEALQTHRAKDSRRQAPSDVIAGVDENAVVVGKGYRVIVMIRHHFHSQGPVITLGRRFGQVSEVTAIGTR